MTKSHRRLSLKQNRLFLTFILFILSFGLISEGYSKDNFNPTKPIISGLERIDEATVLKYFENLINDKSLAYDLEKI